MNPSATADPLPLAGRVALVTGASRGVGRAIAVALAASGATVCAVSRTGTGTIEHAGIERFAVDLMIDEQIDSLVRAVAERHGDVSILVHAAGMYVWSRLESAEVASFDAQYRLNLRAPYVLTQRLLRALRATAGHVVFINSTTSGRAGVGQYAATKFGLRAFAESLREEVNPDGVRVTTIHLGRTATDMQRAVHEAEGRTFDPDRLIQPEDVAATVVHALSLAPTAQISELWLLTGRTI